MKRKILLGVCMMYFLPLMLTLMQSCVGGCGGSKYFEVMDLKAILMYQDNPYNNETIAVGDIRFWLRAEARYYSFRTENFSGYLMACSPLEPEAKETITGIEVFSNQNFEGFPAGVNLAPILQVENSKGISMNLVEYLNTKPKAQEKLNLYFRENAKPVSGAHQFNIVYKDSAGKVFRFLFRDVTFE